MAMSIPTMDWSFRPLSEGLKIFKARIELYFEDQKIEEETKKATKIKIAIGDEGMRRVLNSGLSETEQKKPEFLWRLLEDEVDFSVKISFRVHRLEFSNIKQKDEPLQQYISKLREKATKCAFEPDELNERLIEMVILSTPHEEFRKELFTKPKGTKINEVLERGREYEAIIASQESLKTMGQQSFTTENNLPDPTKVDALQRNYKPGFKKRSCLNCGLIHAPRPCPAYNDLCHGCGIIGHWRKFCRKSQTRNTANKESSVPQSIHSRKIPSRGNDKNRTYRSHEIDFSQNEEEEPSLVYYSIAMADINTQSKDSEAFVTLDINHKNIEAKMPRLHLKVDTGAGGNTLPLRTYKQMFKNIPTSELTTPEPTMKLTSYSGNEIPCIGSIRLGIKKAKASNFHHEKFYIVDVNGPAILGLPSCQKLQIIQLNIDTCMSTQKQNPPSSPTINEKPTEDIKSIQQLKAAYPNQFDRVGKFSEPAKLYLKENAMPSCDAPRKVSIHLKPKIKAELQKMEQEDIIRKLDVNEHSDWCSSLVYVTKPNGDLRICLDPKKLNQNLKRYPQKIPTIEEINPIFSKATLFSKLDAKAGYWSVPLHEESQILTTFRTPFGRYCWKRLPFGLNVSQDIFQARMDMVTEGLKGVANIADDIGIAGTDQKDHDVNLIAFMDRAQASGLSFNSTKCVISQPD